jgi:hypothetical protein
MKKSINDNGSLKNWKSAIANRKLRNMGGVPDLKFKALIKQQWSQFSQ